MNEVQAETNRKINQAKEDIEKASEKGIDIKIDTIISEDGERKEIKIEVKAGNN